MPSVEYSEEYAFDLLGLEVPPKLIDTPYTPELELLGELFKEVSRRRGEIEDFFPYHSNICGKIMIPHPREVLEKKNEEFIQFLEMTRELRFHETTIKSIELVDTNLLMVTITIGELDNYMRLSDKEHDAYFFITIEIFDGSISLYESSLSNLCLKHKNLAKDEITGVVIPFTSQYRPPVEYNYITIVSLYLTEFAKQFGEEYVTFELFTPNNLSESGHVCRICDTVIEPIPVDNEESWVFSFVDSRK